MQTFFIQLNCGVAVVNADSPREAFELLVKHETKGGGEEDGYEPYLAGGNNEADMKPLPTTRGVIIYYAA